MTSPVCSICNDTHAMTLNGAVVMCTRCPVPCQACRSGGNGPFCESTPCPCTCHRKPERDPVAELAALLRAAGIRPTFDPDRNIRRPCVICGEEDAPRELVTIGTYTRRMGGNLRPGDQIQRPMCARCEELTR